MHDKQHKSGRASAAHGPIRPTVVERGTVICTIYDMASRVGVKLIRQCSIIGAHCPAVRENGVLSCYFVVFTLSINDGRGQ